MKTHVIGKNIEITYHVEPHSHQEKQEDGSMRFIFDARPELVSEVTKEEPVEICAYEGTPQTSTGRVIFSKYINIGDEEVKVTKETFYADLGDWKQFVDKNVTITEINKEDAEKKLEQLTRNYNRQIIEGDERMRMTRIVIRPP